jgi:aldehyde dehydrogenase (NAD+)
MSSISFDSRGVFIAGQWRECAGARTLPLLNPSDGTPLAQIARGTAADIDAAVQAARAALDGEWGRLGAAERGRVLVRMSALVLAQADELARLEALDVGKPLKQAAPTRWRWRAISSSTAAPPTRCTGRPSPLPTGYTAFTLREPHGVTGHIVPWNYPMQIIGRSVGAALAMGNACVLKPAEQACLTRWPSRASRTTPGCRPVRSTWCRGWAKRPVRRWRRTPGCSTHLVHRLGGGGPLIQAAAARHTMPVTLELGGKSPQIVFADADLDAALPFLVNAGIQNAGQTCSAAPHPGRAQRVRHRGRAHGRALPRAACRSGAAGPGPRPADLRAAARSVLGYLALAHEGGSRSSPRARWQAMRPAAATTSTPTLVAACRPSTGWRRRRSSARCRR